MNESVQNCPICSRKVEVSESFPTYVCNTCAAHAKDAQGETVIFYHTHINATGYQGYYRRNKEFIPFTGNTCFINGIKCFAVYDHLGAVVLVPEERAYESIRNTGRHAKSMVGKGNLAEVG